MLTAHPDACLSRAAAPASMNLITFLFMENKLTASVNVKAER